MRTLQTLVLLALMSCVPGCKTVTAPPAPGYSSATDQQIGESLAAVDAFVAQEKLNYSAMPPVQQGQEKTALNALITATNAANAAYTAYHAGTQTIQQVQSALTAAQNAQAVLVSVKGVK